MKILSARTELFHAVRRTDRWKGGRIDRQTWRS